MITNMPGFQSFFSFLHHFVLAASNIRIKMSVVFHIITQYKLNTCMGDFMIICIIDFSKITTFDNFLEISMNDGL